jgi:hypothetical protein
MSRFLLSRFVHGKGCNDFHRTFGVDYRPWSLFRSFPVRLPVFPLGTKVQKYHRHPALGQRNMHTGTPQRAFQIVGQACALTCSS